MYKTKLALAALAALSAASAQASALSVKSLFFFPVGERRLRPENLGLSLPAEVGYFPLEHRQEASGPAIIVGPELNFSFLGKFKLQFFSGFGLQRLDYKLVYVKNPKIVINAEPLRKAIEGINVSSFVATVQQPEAIRAYGSLLGGYNRLAQEDKDKLKYLCKLPEYEGGLPEWLRKIQHEGEFEKARELIKFEGDSFEVEGEKYLDLEKLVREWRGEADADDAHTERADSIEEFYSALAIHPELEETMRHLVGGLNPDLAAELAGRLDHLLGENSALYAVPFDEKLPLLLLASNILTKEDTVPSALACLKVLYEHKEGVARSGDATGKREALRQLALLLKEVKERFKRAKPEEVVNTISIRHHIPFMIGFGFGANICSGVSLGANLGAGLGMWQASWSLDRLPSYAGLAQSGKSNFALSPVITMGLGLDVSLGPVVALSSSIGYAYFGRPEIDWSSSCPQKKFQLASSTRGLVVALGLSLGF